MERRNFLRSLGGVAAASTLGGAALLSTNTAAAASGELDYGTTSMVSDDGTLDHVGIFGDSHVEWEGFDTDALGFDVTVRAAGNRIDSPILLHETQVHDLTQSSWGGAGEKFSGAGTSGWIESDIGYDNNEELDESKYWLIVAPNGDPSNADHSASSYGLPTNAVDASRYTVSNDGNTNTYTIRLLTTYTWYADTTGDSAIFSKEFPADIEVTVENRAADATASDGEKEDGAVSG